MIECKDCKYAIWDCEEYFGGGKQYFVTDCMLGNNEEDCQEFEEYIAPGSEGW